MKSPARVAVLASGGGTNLQALLDHFNRRGSADARVELVVASRAGIGATDRANAAGVESAVIQPDPDSDRSGERLLSLLAETRIDAIALAGYLKLVPLTVVQRYSGRILNIHPALLPAFGGPGMYGLRVHRAVIASGARVSGATVHLVGERYDEGPIVAQWPVPVFEGDTPEALAARVLRVEHILYPHAVERLVRGEVGPSAAGFEAFDLIPGALPPDAGVARLLRS